ncbi:uncharacterized protein LOC130799259 [Amaranthus tricolor]|uniref:uncharacterized protein LOC130799259 n=1 Tax=Amaranthus tricolor TaxID=29722 RepID=UPI0025849A06|nr:uncharacterized protein LOC130799259 [Amaranthus tricolor]
MATRLKRDPIVILRVDSEELEEYINSPSFETDMVVSFSELALSYGTNRNLDLFVKALQKLGVDQGLPPTSDPWVMNNIVEPALNSCSWDSNNGHSVSQETFLEELRKYLKI